MLFLCDLRLNTRHVKSAKDQGPFRRGGRHRGIHPWHDGRWSEWCRSRRGWDSYGGRDNFRWTGGSCRGVDSRRLRSGDGRNWRRGGKLWRWRLLWRPRRTSHRRR